MRVCRKCIKEANLEADVLKKMDDAHKGRNYRQVCEVV